MPKCDFNVPLLDDAGNPVTRPVYDRTKTKPDPVTGQLISPVKVDAEGNAVFETQTVGDMLVQAVNHTFQGDENLTYEERRDRGKLVRKLADKTKGSLKNYTAAEIVTIQNLITKAGGAPLLLAQVDDIVGDSGDKPAADTVPGAAEAA